MWKNEVLFVRFPAAEELLYLRTFISLTCRPLAENVVLVSHGRGGLIPGLIVRLKNGEQGKKLVREKVLTWIK